MMEHDDVRKRTYICMCAWLTWLYSRNLTEHCQPAMMEKIKIIKKKKKNAEVYLQGPFLSYLYVTDLSTEVSTG